MQIPYETTVNSSAVLSINNNGQVTTQTFQVAAAAPGIFTNSAGALVPTASAALGQEIAFYITGAGAVSPAISDGAAPAASTALADLPKPDAENHGDHWRSPRRLSISSAFRAGLVGVTQINVQVPNGIAAGAQPVVVTVGGVPSPPATITITN